MDGLYITLEKLMGDVLYKFKYVHNLEKMYPHGSWRENWNCKIVEKHV